MKATKSEKRILKSMIIPMVAITLAYIGFSIYNLHKYIKITEKNLNQVTETFNSCEIDKGYIEIICESGNEYKISKVAVEEEQIETISKGSELLIGITEKEIFELSVNGNQIVTLTEIKKSYKKDTIKDIISVFIACCVVIALDIFKAKRKKNKGIYQSYDIKKPQQGEITIDKNVYDQVQASIYQENGLYRCDIMEYMEREDLKPTVYQAVMDYIREGFLMLMIDKSGKNDSRALVCYKLDNKLSIEHVFKNNDKFKIDSTLRWIYPYNSEVTNEEKDKYKKVVEQYVLLHWDISEV